MADRLTQAARRAEVEKLLGSELYSKYKTTVEYGIRAKFTPTFLANAIIRHEKRIKREAP